MPAPPRAPACLVLGDVCTDIMVRLDEPLALGSDAAASIRQRGGGSAANVAAWLAGEGLSTVLVARTGDDAAGRREEDRLTGLGVGVRFARDERRPTGTVVAVVDASGERTMLTDRGANAGLEPGDLPVEAFATSQHLHLSGYPLLHAGSRPAAFTALRLAREAGLSVSVDPSSHAPLRATGSERFLAWTRGAELCLLNRAEAAVLAGTDDPAEASERLIGCYRAVVVTLGEQGARWRGPHGSEQVEAGETGALDTTGAGDAFKAGFLAVWLRGGGPREALDAGAALAAQAVMTVGARPS